MYKAKWKRPKFTRITSSIANEPLREIKAGMLANSVVIAIVDNAELSHDLSTNGSLNGPIMRIAGLDLPLQHAHIDDLGTQPVQDDPNVFDWQVWGLFKIWTILTQRRENSSFGHSYFLQKARNSNLRIII